MQKLGFEMCYVAREVLFPKLSFVAECIPIPSGRGVIFFGQFLEKCGLIFAVWLTREAVGSSSPPVGDWEATKRFLPREHRADNLFWDALRSLVCLFRL